MRSEGKHTNTFIIEKGSLPTIEQKYLTQAIFKICPEDLRSVYCLII